MTEPPATPDKGQLDIQPEESLEGVVERIVFESDETGFMVARLQSEAHLELITIVGKTIAITVGETVRLKGRWIDNKKFGKQFEITAYESVMPATVKGIEKYLGSGLVEGIGPKMAERIVKAFGVETFKIIEEQPHRLRNVSGIGKKRAGQIREAWQSQRAIQSIMVFLQGHGITTSQSAKIYQAYGDNAVTVLRRNPYRLAEDIVGISFKGADKIARELGIAVDAPERMKAGLLHSLQMGSVQGHVFLERDVLCIDAAELLGISGDLLGEYFDPLVAEDTMRREGERYFLPHLHIAETGCSETLKQLISTPLPPLTIKMDIALKWVEKHHKIELSEEQRQAIRTGIEQKVMVITGGPGTGKTTVINSLLAILDKKSIAYLLAAPTGRAAKRMEAATGHEARTIHRLLEFSPKDGGFQKNQNNPLCTDLVVIDEASMIDVQLMHSLLRALPPFARLILVGDIDQLPSVGPGNILTDLIASQILPVVRLKTIFRQAEQSGIVAAAHQINIGSYPVFNEEDFFLIERDDPAQAVETIVELVTHRIPNKFGLDPLRDIQVLSPMRRGEAGVNNLNEVLQAALNPNGAPIPRRNFRKGDKVMQLRNNYDLDVYNGDVGVITLVEEETSELEVTFDDQQKVLYAFDQCDDLGLAYAATVHKSQGSEYPCVVLALMPQHYMMLQRNLLYTAITRGKQRVITVGTSKAVGMAVRNNKILHRNTLLTERLRNKLLMTIKYVLQDIINSMI